jgi:hypothetical protein
MYYTSHLHVRMFVTFQYIILFVYFYIYLLAIWTLVLIIFAQFLYRYGISALLKEITLSFYLYAIYLRPADLTHVFLCLLFLFFSNTYSLIHVSISRIGGSNFCWVKELRDLRLSVFLHAWRRRQQTVPKHWYLHTNIRCAHSKKYESCKFEFCFQNALTYSMEQISFWEANRFSGRTFRLTFTDVYSGHRIYL